jgi:hypothetical protein
VSAAASVPAPAAATVLPTAAALRLVVHEVDEDERILADERDPLVTCTAAGVQRSLNQRTAMSTPRRSYPACPAFSRAMVKISEPRHRNRICFLCFGSSGPPCIVRGCCRTFDRIEQIVSAEPCLRSDRPGIRSVEQRLLESSLPVG